MEILTLKNVIALIAIVLTIISYAPYFRDVLKGKTRPHLFSWFIWTIVTFIIFALQVSAGAGPAAMVTLLLAIFCLLISILSLKNGEKNIKRIDLLSLLLALLALPLWLLVNQPLLSTILLLVIDMLGFAPTVRKSWDDPFSETLSTYAITSFRHLLSIMALQSYNAITLLFPGIWGIACAIFSIMLIIRRKVL